MLEKKGKTDTISNVTDTYTEELVKDQYALHLCKKKNKCNKKIGIRMPSISEDISENLIKFIIHKKLYDTTSTWNCKNGDLQSQHEGKQEIVRLENISKQNNVTTGTTIVSFL